MVLKRITSTLKIRYYRNCKSKMAYPSYNEALDKCVRCFMEEGEELTIYKCPFGNHYHVGHKSKNSLKRWNWTNKKLKLTLLEKV